MELSAEIEKRTYVETRINAFRKDCIREEFQLIEKLLTDKLIPKEKALFEISTALSSVNFFVEKLSLCEVDPETISDLSLLYHAISYELGSLPEAKTLDLNLTLDFLLPRLNDLKQNIDRVKVKALDYYIKFIIDGLWFNYGDEFNAALASIGRFNAWLEIINLESINSHRLSDLIFIETKLQSKLQDILGFDSSIELELSKQIDCLTKFNQRLVVHRIVGGNLFEGADKISAKTLILNFRNVGIKECKKLFLDYCNQIPTGLFNQGEIHSFLLLANSYIKAKSTKKESEEFEEIFADSIFQLSMNIKGIESIYNPNTGNYPPVNLENHKFKWTSQELAGSDISFFRDVLGLDVKDLNLQYVKETRFPSILPKDFPKFNEDLFDPAYMAAFKFHYPSMDRYSDEF